jgi:hypothetical protein
VTGFIRFDEIFKLFLYPSQNIKLQIKLNYIIMFNILLMNKYALYQSGFNSSRIELIPI